MRIGINASFLRKKDSGIGQVTFNFLRKLKELKVQSASWRTKLKDLEVLLYLEEDFVDESGVFDSFEKKVILPGCYKRDDLIRKTVWEKYLLPEQVRKDQCDVLFSLYQSVTSFANDVASQGKNIRHVMLVHDTVWRIFPEYLNNWRKKIYYNLVDKGIRAADEIITVSQNSKQDIKQYIFSGDKQIEKKISVVPIDCDPIYKKQISNEQMQQVLEKYGLESREYLFYIGGFDARKNVGALIEAYGRLYEKMKEPTPNLVLAGKFHSNLVPLVTNISEKTQQLIDRYNIPAEKIIHLDQFIPQEDVPALYKGAKLFCYPSLYEGFGLPPLEALNVGCPVVTSNVSSLPEIVDEKSAILVNPEDIESIADGMYRGLTDESLRTNLVADGKVRSQHFSWEKFTEEVIKILNDKF